MKKVFAFFLRKIGQTDQLVFARGESVRDALQVAQQFGEQTGRNAVWANDGQPVDMEWGRGAAGAPMLEPTAGGVAPIGAMSGLGATLMAQYFGGDPVTAAGPGEGGGYVPPFMGSTQLPGDSGGVDPNLLNPPGGGAGGGMQGMRTPIVGSEELGFGPSYRAGLSDRGIRLGLGGGVAGALAEEFRRPTQSRAFANIAFNDPTITGTEEEATLPSFQEYVRTGDIFGAGAAQDARRLLDQARGFGSDTTGLEELAAGIVKPATTGQAQTLANIARQAARQRYGAFAKFLPSAADFGEQYLAQPSGGALTFGDFLNQKIFGT